MELCSQNKKIKFYRLGRRNDDSWFTFQSGGHPGSEGQMKCKMDLKCKMLKIRENIEITENSKNDENIAITENSGKC